MMKKILISLTIIFIVGCENTEQNQITISKLNEKIKDLEIENIILKDSLNDYEKSFLYSQILVGVPEYQSQKIGKKNKITVLFHSYNVEIPEYDIFKIEGEKRIKIGTNNRTSFDYEFVPKSINDNNLDLIIKIPFNNKTLEIPANMTLDLKE